MLKFPRVGHSVMVKNLLFLFESVSVCVTRARVCIRLSVGYNIHELKFCENLYTKTRLHALEEKYMHGKPVNHTGYCQVSGRVT
jgi:hypothetical protein